MDVLAVVANEQWLPAALQVFYSAKKYGNWKGDYLVVAVNCWPESLCDKGIHVAPVSFDGAPNYGKFHLLKTDMQKWDRVICYDGDVIIETDINDLSNVNQFSAVQEPNFPLLKNQIAVRRWKAMRKMGFDLTASVFNGGFFVLPTSEIKTHWFNDIWEIEHKFKDWSLATDQHIQNIMFYKKWHPLDAKYNCLTPNKNKKQVQHFAGQTRPWKPNSEWKDRWNTNYKNALETSFGSQTTIMHL